MERHIPWIMDTIELKDKEKTCWCTDVYDGDTVTLVFELDNKMFKHKCRIAGIDTPEIRTKNLEEKKYAKKVRNFVKELIVNKYLTVKFHGFDKYHRYIVDIYIEHDLYVDSQQRKKIRRRNEGKKTKILDISDLVNKDGNVNIKDVLLKKNMAYIYNGKKRKNFNEWYIPRSSFKRTI